MTLKALPYVYKITHKITSVETKIKLSLIQLGSIWANDWIKSFKIKNIDELKEGQFKGRLHFKKKL